MAENVGSVSISLLLDREQFDADLLKLAEEGPIDLDFRAGLDLKQLEKDLSALKRRTIDIDLNTVELRKQLDAVLVGRSIDVRARLDKGQFYRDLDTLGDGRSTALKISLDDQFDSRAMDLRIRQATADRYINFVGKADFQELQTNINNISKINPVSIGVDTKALQELTTNVNSLKSGSVGVPSIQQSRGVFDDRDNKQSDKQLTNDLSELFKGIQKDFSKAYSSGKPGLFTNTIRGFQEGIGGTVARTVATGGIAAIEANYGINFADMGANSVKRFDRVAQFAKKRVERSVENSEVVQEFRRNGAEMRPILKQVFNFDTTLADKKLSVIELRVGKIIDDVFRLQKTPIQLGNIKDLASDFGDYIGTPLDNIKTRKQSQQAIAVEKVKTRAAEIVASGAVDQYKNSDRATFVIGGFAGEKGESSPGVAERIAPILPNDAIIPIKNIETDLPANIGAGKRKYVGNVASRFIKQNITQGYNSDSIETAAQAMAIKQVNPNATINMVGYSAGGFVAAEATSLLERSGIDSKAVGIGTPLFGMTQTFNPDRYKSINGSLDYLTPISKKGLSDKSRYEVVEGAGAGHRLNDYLGNPAAQASIMKNLGRENTVPEEYRSPAGFILPEIRKQAEDAYTGVANIAQNPQFAKKTGIANILFETTKRTRQEIHQVIEGSIGSVADELEGLESMLAEMQNFVAQFAGITEPIAPIKTSLANDKARAVGGKVEEIKTLPPIDPIVDQEKLTGLTSQFKAIPRNSEDAATTAKRLDSYNQDVIKEIYRAAGLGTAKGSKAETLAKIKGLTLVEQKAAIDVVEPNIERGPKGGQKLIKPKQTQQEQDLIAYLQDAEVRIRAASDVYAQSEGDRKGQIRSAIKNEIDQLIEATKTLDRRIVAPETRQAVGGLKGRLAQTSQFIEPEEAPQLARVAPVTTFDRLKQKASQIFGDRRTIERVSPLASTAASLVASSAAEPLGPVAKTLASIGASTAVRVAGDSVGQPKKQFSLSALVQSPKAQNIVQEMTIAGAGMLASNLAGSQGSIAGAAASIGGTLATRLALSAGVQYKTALDKLNKQEEYIAASLRDKAKMLGGIAKQISFKDQGAGIAGDVSGFAIYNGATIAKNMAAGALGVPAIAQMPIDAIAATVLPGKVAGLRSRFAEQPELAKAQEPIGLLGRFKQLVSPKTKEYSQGTATENFKSFYGEVAKTSGVTARVVPSLQVADNKLEAVGASALYDVKTNTILISESVAHAISQPIGKLGKYSKELQALTHESQHSIQMDGGRLNIAEAAQGKAVQLQAPKMPSRVEKSIAASIDIAASQSPAIDRTALRKLEVDAYAKESQTGLIIRNMQGPQRSIIDRGRDFIASKMQSPDRKLQNNFDSIVRTAADYSGVSLTPQTMPTLKVDDAKLKSMGANAYLNIKRNQILISQKAAALLSATMGNIEAQQKAAMSIIHEARHSFQFKGGQSSIALQALGGAPGVPLISYSQAPKSAQFMGLQSAQVAKTQSMGLLPQAFLKTIAATETDAYAFEKVYGPEIYKTAQTRKPQPLLQSLKEQFSPGTPPDKGPIESFKTVLARAGESIREFPGGGLILSSLKGIAAGFIGVNLAMMAAQVASKIYQESIQAAIAADRMKTSLAFSTGSKGSAEKAYNYASNQAETLGIDRKSSIEGYAKLRASSKGKLSEGQTNQLFEGVASASTTLGLSADDQNGVFLALGQVMSKGTVQAEELRGQIGERLPGAFAIAARSMNMSEAQLGKAMESGSVSAEQFIPRFGAQMKQEFGPSAKDASQNLQSSMFRLSGATGKATEDIGGTLAVPVKFGVDAAIGGITLLTQHGNTLIAMLGTALGSAAFKALGSFVAYNGGLMAMASSTLAAVGGVAGITAAIGKAASVIGPFVAKFLLMNAAIEIGKTLFSGFTPDDMGSRFEAQSKRIKQSLQEISEKGKNAQKDATDLSAPSKGLDINAATLGLSGMVGINKGDDLIKFINSNAGIQVMLSVVPGIGWGKNINEENGGVGFATFQEFQYNQSRESLGRQGGDIYNATGEMFSNLPQLTQAAKASQLEQNTIDSKQAERARLLSTGSPDKAKIATIDNEIKKASERRDKSGAGFADQKNIIETNLAELRSQRESLKTNQDYSPTQKKELEGDLNAQIGQLEVAKRQLDAIDKKFGGSADIMGKFNVALSEMAAKIEEASAIAKNAFNQAEVKRLGDRKSDRGKDDFATQNNAVRQAENEQRRADGELKGSKVAIAEIDKLMADPTVKTEMAKIAINGKSIDGETSAQQLEQAKVGRSDKEKGQIEKLILRRKTIDNLPEVEKNSLEAEDKVFTAKSARALEKTDRASLDRDNKLKAQEGRANYDLIKAQKKGGMNESDVEINKASISKASADRQVQNINSNIKDVDKLFKEGTISKEEHTKRSSALRNSLVDATVKAAQAELDVEKAKNKKILEDHETNIKRRSVERQEKTGAATIGLIRQQMGNKINESDVDIKKAEIQKQSADGEAADVRKQMGELDQLRAQGILSEQEYIKKKLELRSKLVDADVKAAEAALAVEQAKNRKILNEWAQTIKKREVGAQRVEGAATVQLIKGQMGNKMSEEDVNIRKAEIQGRSSNAAVANLEAQMREVAALKSRGVITEEDYNKRILDIESNLIAAKTRSAEAVLALEQAKNRKLVAEFDQMQKRQEMMVSNDQVASGTQIKRAQLGGQIIGQGGQTETIKYDILATEKRVKMADEARNKDVELRKGGKISEKEFDDRMATNNGKFRAEEEKLVNLLIQQRQGIYQQEHDAFNRANSGIIRGLELRKQRSGKESRLDGSKQGVMESVLGLARAQTEKAVTTSDLSQSQSGGKGDNGVAAASIRLASLGEIHRAEMMILDLKEKQNQASLRQSMIEAQISYGKQRIAVSESTRKLKDAVLTGDQNAIANASEDLSGQQQILSMEGEKINSLETQNSLSAQKAGFDRQAAMLGMDTERMRAEMALTQARKGAGGRLSSGIQQNRIQTNRVIGGGSFLGDGTGINMNSIMNARPTPIASGSWKDLAIGLPGVAPIPGTTTAIDTASLSPVIAAQQGAISADRTVTQATGLVPMDDRGIIAAIDRLAGKLDRLSVGGDRGQQPGYSDYLTANTNAKFART